MSYSYDQLVQAYTALHVGKAPDSATADSLNMTASLSASGQVSDATVISNLVNGADSTTAVAVLSYQFFTGKSPSAAGLTYLVNSATNTADLNDPYYSKFSLENRYINFAANLGVAGEGATAFATKYGSMSYSDYVASIYQTIVGSSYATAAGIDPAAAIASIISRKDAILATAQSAGMIPANATAAQIDIALKAATAGYLMGEAIKADVGLYAAAADNFMIALAQGTAVYNTDITFTYKPSYDTAAHGTGHAIDRAPTDLPTSTGTVTQPTGPQSALTAGVDHIIGTAADNAYTATDATFSASDFLDGGAGNDTLTITGATGGTYTVPSFSHISNIETINLSNNAGINANTAFRATGLLTLNVTAIGDAYVYAPDTANTTLTVTNQGSNAVQINGAHSGTIVATGGADTGSGGGYTSSSLGDQSTTGDNTITRTTVGAGAAGVVRAYYGAHISVTQLSTGVANNATQTNGLVEIIGGFTTTSVTVNNPNPVAASGSNPGIIGGEVHIDDRYSNTGLLSFITTVSINGFAGMGNTANSNALTNLTLAHSSANSRVTIDGGTAAGQATTLNLTVNGLGSNTTLVDNAHLYTTLNITTGAEASYLTPSSFTNLTTLSVSGPSALDLGLPTLAALTNLTISGAGGLTAYLAGSGSLTTVDAHASTGNNTITFNLNAPALTYTGGSGNDSIIVGGAANMIDVGSGTDTVSINVINALSSSVYTSITGMGVGDMIKLDHVTNATTVGAQISLGVGATFQNYLDAAADDVAGTTNTIHWFEFGSDTYIVVDNSDAHSFQDNHDMIVKLTGTTGLHLNTHPLVSGVLTL